MTRPPFPPSPPPARQDLLVDQTIEKVSFCAPDRNFDKAFSYICRDGTTRRWICHCFLALKDSVGTGLGYGRIRGHGYGVLWGQGYGMLQV